jgi:hypothetical protein
VRIRKEGYDVYEGLHTFEAGRTTQLRIDLRPALVNPSPAPRPTSGEPSADPPPSSAPSAANPSDPARAAAEGSVDPTSGILEPAAAEPAGSRRGLVVALATTGGLTVLSAGVWIGFALKGASLQREADQISERIRAQTPATCPEGGALCGDLRDVSERRATANQVAAIGGIVMGVSAAAFVASWLLWPKVGSPGLGVSGLVPQLAWGRAGIDLVGAFE